MNIVKKKMISLTKSNSITQNVLNQLKYRNNSNNLEYRRKKENLTKINSKNPIILL
jgi:hypothetical protein